VDLANDYPGISPLEVLRDNANIHVIGLLWYRTLRERAEKPLKLGCVFPEQKLHQSL